VSENTAVKGKFGAAREKVREELRKLHNKKVSCFLLLAKYH
jgi:hypothetical protein